LATVAAPTEMSLPTKRFVDFSLRRNWNTRFTYLIADPDPPAKLRPTGDGSMQNMDGVERAFAAVTVLGVLVLVAGVTAFALL
jgi:hypothetical protein